MTITATHRAPRQIIAGDTIEFLVRVPTDYVGWAGSARLTGASQMDSTSCAAENTDFHVKFAGQGSSGSDTYKTALLTAGQYILTVWATNGTDRVTIAQFPITITADLSTGAPTLEHAVTMLNLVQTAIQARIAGNADGGVEEYAIDGTQVRKLSMLDLERLRNKYSAEVAALQNPNGRIPRVKMAFTPAGGIPDIRRRFG